MKEIHVTRGLLEVLLERAAELDPTKISVELAVSSASTLSGLDLPPEEPVFTTFYEPNAGGSIEAVFGTNLSTPSGRTQGLFVSHPDGLGSLSQTDDLREVVFVAIPPWDIEIVSAYRRNGQRLELNIVDAEPPVDSRFTDL